MADEWASDVPVSMPEPTRYPGIVPMFGLTMTQFGLWHDLNEEEHRSMRMPDFAPMFETAFPVVEHNE